MPKFNSPKNTRATRGILQSGQTLQLQKHLYLDGEWEFYPDLLFTDFPSNLSAFSNPQFVKMPVSNLNEAGKKGVYRLFFESDDVSGNWVLYIPHLKDPITIFVNGIYQPPSEKIDVKSLLRPFQYIIPVTAFDTNAKAQEIVIMVNGEKNNPALYKHSIQLTTANNALSLSYLKTVNSFLIFGMIILITMSGFIFMLLMPQHRIITLITLFDTAIVGRVLFGSNDVIALFMSFFPIVVTDSFLLSAQIFSLLLGGFFGSLLAHYLLDEEHRVPRVFSAPIPIAYLILALTIPFNLDIFYDVSLPIFIAVYVYTFVVVFFQFIVYWKKTKKIYAAFQILKTTYIGCIIFIDIILLSTYTNFLLFEYLFLFFFIAHIVTKLYDNNNSYKEVYLLSKNLEKTVQERTLELSEKNRVLSELSIRDPLTSAYNRLYFDEEIEQAVGEPNENQEIHLCMFDLDHFKSINDTYGHDAGDEQLKNIVQTVQALIPENAVFARVGGEEFMILYIGIDSKQTLENVELLRKTFEKQANKDLCRTTASFGLVKYAPWCSKKDFLKMADKNLYNAKEAGRNRIVCDFSASGE